MLTELGAQRMDGFNPPTITLAANRFARIRIINPDCSHHSDGDGIHQFALLKLGIDSKIQPETTQGVLKLKAS